MLPKLSLPQVVKENATPVSTISFVLSAAFDAYRDGMLDALLSQRPGALRWLMRHYLQPILGTAGDALAANRQMTKALEWLLAWGITASGQIANLLHGSRPPGLAGAHQLAAGNCPHVPLRIHAGARFS